MNSIISSTGMPRKNSSTTAVGMRIHGDRGAAQKREDDAEDDRADRGDRCRLQGRDDALEPMSAPHRGSVKMFQRLPSNMPGSVMPPESRGAARVTMTQAAPARSRTSATIERISDGAGPWGPGRRRGH